jgi:hypothetical protein
MAMEYMYTITGQDIRDIGETTINMALELSTGVTEANIKETM